MLRLLRPSRLSQLNSEDVSLLASLLAGLGLSSASGLNAYLPLLCLALADRISTSFNLPGPYDAVSSNVGILVILLVMVVELVADKIHRLDHYNDLLHTPIRTLTGAFCFMAVVAEADSVNVWLAGALGVALAGGVSFWKLRMRPAITRATNGIGNPVISAQEDLAVIVVSIAALIYPLAIVLVLPLIGWWIHHAETRMAAGNSHFMHILQPTRKT
jgi:hypothetical protein